MDSYAVWSLPFKGRSIADVKAKWHHRRLVGHRLRTFEIDAISLATRLASVAV